ATHSSKRECSAQDLQRIIRLKARDEVLPVHQRSQAAWEGPYRPPILGRSLKIVIELVYPDHLKGRSRSLDTLKPAGLGKGSRRLTIFNMPRFARSDLVSDRKIAQGTAGTRSLRSCLTPRARGRPAHRLRQLIALTTQSENRIIPATMKPLSMERL